MKSKIKYLSAEEPKIFCFILASEKTLELDVKITYDSWAHKCDDHSYVSLIPGKNQNDQRFEKQINNSINLLQPEGLTIDSYSKLTDKVYRMFLDT